MTNIPRRDALQRLVAAPIAAGLAWTTTEARVARARADRARQAMADSQAAYEPQFLTAHEYETVTDLTEMILPADDRSGGAIDAGVPEFIDFMMLDQPARQLAMRQGLGWLDAECERRFGRRFLECSERDRARLLDEIAWPDRAPEHVNQGVVFFSNVRDLTATGFWTSRAGIADLQYLGNRVRFNWQGCPADVLQELGVRYND